MASRSYTEKLAPTWDACEAWRARQAYEPDRRDGFRRQVMGAPSYGLNVWTKGGSCRCVTSVAEWTDGGRGYWTIRGEGSSNGSRETAIRAEDIARAEGWVLYDDEVVVPVVAQVSAAVREP